MEGKILIIGDSITVGSNASTGSLRYADRLADITGREVYVNASSGRTVQEAVQQWNVTNSWYNVLFNPTEQQQQYNTISAPSTGELLIIRLGVNDAIQRPGSQTSRETFKADYITCLEAMVHKGWTPAEIRIVNIGAYLGSNGEIAAAVVEYNAVIREICQEFNIRIIDLKGYEQARDVSTWYSDEVHPNDLGHLEHAKFIASQLQAIIPVASPELTVPRGRLTIQLG